MSIISSGGTKPPSADSEAIVDRDEVDRLQKRFMKLDKV